MGFEEVTCGRQCRGGLAHCGLAAEHGLALIWTPPHVGKYLNPIELLWSIIKARGRALDPASRRSEKVLMGALRSHLKGIGKEKHILNNIAIPSMRFCFAILRATFFQERVVHAQTKNAVAKPILFAELFQACVEFRQGLDSGDFNADDGAMPEGIEFVCRESLETAVPAQRIKFVPTWAQLQSKGGTNFAAAKSRMYAAVRPAGVVPPLLAGDVLSSDEGEVGDDDLDPGDICGDEVVGAGHDDIPGDIGGGLGAHVGACSGQDNPVGSDGHVAECVEILGRDFYRVTMAGGTVYECSHVIAVRFLSCSRPLLMQRRRRLQPPLVQLRCQGRSRVPMKRCMPERSRTRQS